MQFTVYARLGLLISFGLFVTGIYAQRVPDAGRPDTLSVHGRIDVSVDSVSQVRDSLEVSLLRTVRTYQQIERLLLTFPAQSPCLNLLPSVLPVEVPIDAFRITSRDAPSPGSSAEPVSPGY